MPFKTHHKYRNSNSKHIKKVILIQFAFQKLNCSRVNLIFTARKRSLRRLFFTPVCQSFCSQGGRCLPQCMMGYTPPGSRHSPGKQIPPGKQTPSGKQTPVGSRHLPCTVHAGRYGQQAGGTHPTGMHTYHRFFCRSEATVC